MVEIHHNTTIGRNPFLLVEDRPSNLKQVENRSWNDAVSGHPECPVCGHGDTYRERMYGRKPKSYVKRYIFIYNYDWELYT
jgi:hypothetical protein